MAPLPPEQRVNFFVFVIESPSAVDLYHRRSEGEIVRQAVELNGISCIVKTAIALEAFNACLRKASRDCARRSNIQMEPTRLSVRTIMSEWRAAYLARWAVKSGQCQTCEPSH